MSETGISYTFENGNTPFQIKNINGYLVFQNKKKQPQKFYINQIKRIFKVKIFQRP
jgi:hypothetical protein